MLANGQGKVRMTREIRVRPMMEWRLAFLSSGEISLADHLQTIGRQVCAGQEVLRINLAADAGKGMGIFVASALKPRRTRISPYPAAATARANRISETAYQGFMSTSPVPSRHDLPGLGILLNDKRLAATQKS
jgi:hypothetical protein